MGTDNHGSFVQLLQIFLTLQNLNPFFFQILYDNFVVNNRSISINWPNSFFHLLIDRIYRTLYTETKSCSLCQNNILHSIHLLNAVKDQLSKAINDFINIHL